MAGPVDAENAKTRVREPLGERNEHVGRVAGGAVDEKNRAALFAPRRLVEHVDRAAANFYSPARGMARLDPARLELR